MSIYIYQTKNLEDLKELQPHLEELRQLEHIEIEYSHQSATAGDLAGMAAKILMSPEVQITLSTIAVAQVVCEILAILKRLGKKFSISSKTAKLVALYKTQEKINDVGKEYILDKIVTYGPMRAELDVSLSQLCKNEDALEDDMHFSTYFLGVVFPRPRNRVKTIWYLFQHSGDILASWSTQTLSERMPDFLNPSVTKSC